MREAATKSHARTITAATTRETTLSFTSVPKMPEKALGLSSTWLSGSAPKARSGRVIGGRLYRLRCTIRTTVAVSAARHAR
jgi:hypothetical protein